MGGCPAPPRSNQRRRPGGVPPGTGEKCAEVRAADGGICQVLRCGTRQGRKCQAVPALTPGQLSRAPLARDGDGSRRGAERTAMAPEASRLRAGAKPAALPQRALAQYLLLLRLYPVLTKALSSGILSALGNFLGQIIKKKRKKEDLQNLDVSGPLRYAAYGFFVTGPLSHYFYLLMEHLIPPSVPWAGVRRLLLDRLVFAPTFLLLFFLTMNILEGKDVTAFIAKMRSGFWPALRMNWRVWTPVQFININYVPLQFRVLFASVGALFWYTYLASLGK